MTGREDEPLALVKPGAAEGEPSESIAGDRVYTGQIEDEIRPRRVDDGIEMIVQM